MNRERHVNEDTCKFTSLAPILEPNKDSIYQRALRYAVEEDNVFNIAITGPYASGKSSIIKRYVDSEDNNSRTLVVSLASFEGAENPDSDELEVGILQQILYSSDSESLPDSRFKRIKRRKSPTELSFFILGWLLALVTIVLTWNENVSTPFFGYSSIIYLLLVSAFLGTSVLLVNKIINFIGQVNFKRVSIRNIEFEAASSETSVLNKYLDEILYFFEVKNYDIVVFEDIDRFKCKEIFIKLREINSLINNNEKIKSTKKVKFIYAVKDSTFTGGDRTKFFDFIIPVIPTVGHYNSEVLLKERKEQLPKTHKTLSKRVIDDVSDYLNDPRLINNIFNELTVYMIAIGDHDINIDELFAVIIYKNIFSEDFEKLHDSTGYFKDLIFYKKTIIDDEINSIFLKIKAKEKRISDIVNESVNSEKELLNIYTSEIFKRGGVKLVIPRKKECYLKDFDTVDEFLDYANDSSCHMGTVHNHSQNFELSEIEKEINKSKGIKERLDLINDRKENKIKELRKESEMLEREISDLKNEPLSMVLKRKPEALDGYFRSKDKFESKSDDVLKFDQRHRLMRYLILEGLLNENYELYTALFKEHDEWSKNDRRFITTLKSREEPSPTLKIDHPSDVIKRMNDADKISPYVLNLDFFNYSLSLFFDGGLKRDIFQSYRENYNSNLRRCFSRLYFKEGNCRSEFFREILKFWDGYLDFIWSDSENFYEMSAFIRIFDVCELKGKYDFGLVKRRLSTELNLFLDSCETSKDKDCLLSNLKSLDVKVEVLPNISEYEDVPSFIIESCLYKITDQNFAFILSKESYVDFDIGYKDILSLDDKKVLKYVNNNVVEFYHGVILSEFNNWSESEVSIVGFLKVIEGDSIAEEVFKRNSMIKIEKDEIPIRFLNLAYKYGSVKPSWEALCYGFTSQEVADDSIVSYLNQEFVCEGVLSQPMGRKARRDLDESIKVFIRNLNSIDTSCYIKLNHQIGFKCTSFPEGVSNDKLIGLSDNKLVKLSSSTFDYSRQVSPELQASLILNSQQEFLESAAEYEPLSVEVKELILASNKSTENLCIKILKGLSNNDLNDSVRLSNLACEKFFKINRADFDFHLILTSIKNSDDVKVNFKLFETIVSSLDVEKSLEMISKKIPEWSEDKVMSALSLVPSSEVNKIAQYGKVPKLEKSQAIIDLADKLDSHHYVSSISYLDGFIKINTKRRAPKGYKL